MNRIKLVLMFAGIYLSIAGCRKDPAKTDLNPYYYNADWSTNSHEKTEPHYEKVFPQSNINTIEITLTTAQWSEITSNMVSLFGISFGANNSIPNQNATNTDPIYVDANVKFEGKQWKNVGFRLRGNKMLGNIWNSGIYKLPFHLNFDKFEDQIPGIKNQRFFGFKELVFNPGHKDPSLIREKLASDIYRMGGLIAPQTAFYKVYINFGAGLKYCGVYCAAELPEDNLLLNFIRDKSGDLYKPTSQLNLFQAVEFPKKTNENVVDFSNIKQFVAQLNSPNRISNPAQWHAAIENHLDVNQFLLWLAISNTMVNPGGYGTSAENYYLYHLSNGKFIWIPWDNNEAMSSDPGIVGAAGGNGSNGLSLSMNEVTANWPLIRYLMDDAIFYQEYKNQLRNFDNNIWNITALQERVDQYYKMIQPFVIGTNGEQTGYSLLTNSSIFISQQEYLKSHIYSRKQLIRRYAP